MREAPTGKTAHVDTFVRDRLPRPEHWPTLLYDLSELDYAPQTNVVTELLDNHIASGRGSQPVLRIESGDWTYEELRDKANRLARLLTEDFGLVPGGRVLLRAPNNPMMIACWMAVAKAGGVVVATMPLLRSRELRVIANKANVSLALCDEQLMEEMESAYESDCPLEYLLTFEDAERLANEKPAGFDNVATAIDDPVLIAFTSGTTGVPKGCVHFHRDLLASADTFFKGTLPCDASDVFTGSPPVAFTFGLGMQTVFPMRAGASTALVEKPSPEAILEACQRHGVTVLSTAPTAYRAMTPLVGSYDVSSLRHCISAGETLPLPTAEAWREATGLRIIDGIGATEMFHIFISAVGDDIRPGATGKPVYGYEAKVFDDEMTEVPPNTVGRLAVRGPTGCRYLDEVLFFTLNREDFSFVIHLDRQPRTSRRREAQTGSRARSGSRSGSRSERTLDAVEHSRTLMEWWPFLIFHRGGLRIKVINNNERQMSYVRDGWNFSGDAYLVDEDGYFWFQAHADDMIISAGYNISGPEVEEALLAHEDVADCACVASPDDERGNIVKAFVVLNGSHEGDAALVKTLQSFVKERIAPYKYPRAITFVDALPRTETGKVQRFKLRQEELERKKES